MENEILDDQSYHNGENGLQVSSEVKNYLYETAKWGKFLAIIGFVFLGLFVVLAFFMMFFMSSMGDAAGLGAMSGAAFGILYLLIALFYLYPTLKLYKFSSKVKSGLEHNAQMDFNEAFSNLKSMFKFMGVLMAIMIGLYALIFVFGGAAALMGGM